MLLEGEQMLNVKTPDEVISIINDNFHALNKSELLPLEVALDRILFEDVLSNEYVPSFNRSSVDGYALFSKDTFGCTESIPAVLKLSGNVEMGEDITEQLDRYHCVYVPTGGKVPAGADAVVMIEYTEKFSQDEIAVIKPVSPGENMIYKGDDSTPGQIVCKKGTQIKAQHIGTFASLGIDKVKVAIKPTAGIISTGDELVDIKDKPKEGQVRDVNSYLLKSQLEAWGCNTKSFGFIKDDETLLRQAIDEAINTCDLVIVSGGSSVGQKDATARIIEEYSPLLFHGIAMKPGKPTILANYNKKALIGLPGHPGASFFVSNIFVKPIICRLLGKTEKIYTIPAILEEAISANQGRAVYIGISLHEENGSLYAKPIQSKSGLITSLTKADGYICVPRNCEGFSKGSTITVYSF